MKEISPLNVNIKKCVAGGHTYDALDVEEYVARKDYICPEEYAVLYKDNDKVYALPFRGISKGKQTVPGVYDDGCISHFVLPNNDRDREIYSAKQVIDMSNRTPIKEILEKKQSLSRLDEHWITTPDNITQFTITPDDKAEMKCLKMALNKKQIDIDKYSGRFGQNFPNDKRQLKNNSATLNIIKRFCKHMDMEAILTLKDKNGEVPNPMNTEITVSLTDDYEEDDD